MIPFQPEPNWYQQEWESEVPAGNRALLRQQLRERSARTFRQALVHIPLFDSPEPDWYQHEWESEAPAANRALLQELIEHAARTLRQALVHIPLVGFRTSGRWSWPFGIGRGRA